MVPYRPRGTGRSHDPLSDITFVRGSGTEVFDSRGRRYLDFIGGYSACVLGHCHPRLVQVATEQLSRLSFAHAAQCHERTEFESVITERLLSGHPDVKVWLTTGGARAVELAWKIATAVRPGGILRFDLAYHGRSLATAGISDTARSCAISLPPDQVSILSFPVAQPSEEVSLERRCEEVLQGARELLSRRHRELSMLLLEPAIGSRGYFFAPPWFCKRLADLAHDFGLLVVSDEIQMGLGRMGAWSVAVADEWNPDLIVLGKSLGGGILSMGAVLGRSELMDSLPEGIESETYAAMPLACSIGCEVIRILEQEALVDQAEVLGREFRSRLRRLIPESISVAGRGWATALGFESYGSMSTKMAREWVVDLSKAGLLVHLTGPARDRLALIPPLNVSPDTALEALEILAHKSSSC
jgi:4-aminobutyrate aminotransferase-like enzyme